MMNQNIRTYMDTAERSKYHEHRRASKCGPLIGLWAKAAKMAVSACSIVEHFDIVKGVGATKLQGL